MKLQLTDYGHPEPEFEYFSNPGAYRYYDVGKILQVENDACKNSVSRTYRRIIQYCPRWL